jgi:hypothetical protein
MGVKELAGLPNTDLMLVMRIGDQLSLFSRPEISLTILTWHIT